MEQGRADGLTRTLAKLPDMIADRPHCVVTETYCEALGWLRREPACPASLCCRHFWADVEQVAS